MPCATTSLQRSGRNANLVSNGLNQASGSAPVPWVVPALDADPCGSFHGYVHGNDDGGLYEHLAMGNLTPPIIDGGPYGMPLEPAYSPEQAASYDPHQRQQSMSHTRLIPYASLYEAGPARFEAMPNLGSSLISENQSMQAHGLPWSGLNMREYGGNIPSVIEASQTVVQEEVSETNRSMDAGSNACSLLNDNGMPTSVSSFSNDVDDAADANNMHESMLTVCPEVLDHDAQVRGPSRHRDGQGTYGQQRFADFQFNLREGTPLLDESDERDIIHDARSP